MMDRLMWGAGWHDLSHVRQFWAKNGVKYVRTEEWWKNHFTRREERIQMPPRDSVPYPVIKQSEFRHLSAYFCVFPGMPAVPESLQVFYVSIRWLTIMCAGIMLLSPVSGKKIKIFKAGSSKPCFDDCFWTGKRHQLVVVLSIDTGSV